MAQVSDLAPAVPALAATVGEQPELSGTDTETEAKAEAHEPVLEAVQLLAMEADLRPEGFRLHLGLSRPLAHRVTSRSATGISILLPEASLSTNFVTEGLQDIAGLSLYPVAEGLNLSLQTSSVASFQVLTRTDADASSLLLDVVLADAVRQANADESADESAPAPVTAFDAPSLADSFDSGGASLGLFSHQDLQAAQEQNIHLRSEPDSEAQAASAPSKVRRELSFEQRDRKTGRDGIELAQGGRLLEAYRLLLEFVGDNPEAHHSREVLATLLLGQQEFEQAAAIVEQGRSIVPHYVPFQKLHARLLVQQGRLSEALELLRAAPPLVAEDSEYHDLLATLYQRSGDHENALASYRRLLVQDPAQSRWWVAMAISLESLGRLEEARASYQKALQDSHLDIALRDYSRQRVRLLGRQR